MSTHGSTSSKISDRDHLQEWLREEIGRQGGLTFAEFMANCLYHPQHGYYQSPQVRIGRQGDFFTSSSVHRVFGSLVARQLVDMWRCMGGGEFVVVEQGPGEGHLALDILDDLRQTEPEFYSELRYFLVEQNIVSRQRQSELLIKHQAKVDWALEDEIEPFSGCLLSNELIDAFPVHVVEVRGGELQEVFVVNSNDGFAEDLRAPSTSDLQTHLDWLGCGPVEGNRAEINLEAVRWLHRISARLQRGFILTIDYGYPSKELFAPQRRQGTLLCYDKHQAHDNPYQNAGCQDITTHVDFGALQKAGEDAGLQTLWFGEQYRFLMGLGFVEELMVLQAREQDPLRQRQLRLSLKNLIMPDGGMGDTFKVLVQGKGVGQPDLACARSISEIPLPPPM
ncbi:MAG: hypothetical protein C0616_09680 [Desulfuromonas sp.]|nr:MAG: hypothetical protein C0616_09680 [Desulfuromonas sp.]